MGNSERLPPGELPRRDPTRVDTRGLSPRQVALLNAIADEMRPAHPDDPQVPTADEARLVRLVEDELRREAGGP